MPGLLIQAGIFPEKFVQALRCLWRDSVFHLTGIRLGRALIDPEDFGEKKNQVTVAMNEGPCQFPGNDCEVNAANIIPVDHADLFEALNRPGYRGHPYTQPVSYVGYAHLLHLPGEIGDGLDIILLGSGEDLTERRRFLFLLTCHLIFQSPGNSANEKQDIFHGWSLSGKTPTGDFPAHLFCTLSTVGRVIFCV